MLYREADPEFVEAAFRLARLQNIPLVYDTDDLLIDYRECPATPGAAARLVVVGSPAGITPGVAEFTVFGDVQTRRSPTPRLE